MKEALYEENPNNEIELSYMDQNITMNPLNIITNDNNNNITTNDLQTKSKLNQDDQQEIHSTNKIPTQKKGPLLGIIPQKEKIKEYAFDVLNIFSQQYRKYFSFCKAWSIMAQVLFIYLILMLIFLLVIIASKATQIQELIDTQSNKNYYTSIIREMVNEQRDLKIELDKLNNDIRMRNVNAPIVFMNIYTNELIKNKILDGNKDLNTTPFTFNSFSSADKSKEYYMSIDKGFVLFNTLYDLVNPSSSVQGNSGNENYKHLIPFYYHFTPILYQQLKKEGLSLLSMYYAAFPQSSELDAELCKTHSTLYFKYPVELNMKSQSNSKPNDLFIDPVHKCFRPISQKGIKEANWFYKIKQEGYNKDLTMIKLEHIDQDTLINEEYLMSYKTIVRKVPIDIGQSYNILIAMKVEFKGLERPFITLNDNDDTLNYDYASIINLPKSTSQSTSKVGSALNGNTNNNNDDVLFKGYSSDESNTLIIDMPKFSTNMYLYSIQPKSLNDKDTSTTTTATRVSTNIIEYNKMDSIKDDYDINYYYQSDINFFHLSVFVNDFLTFYNTTGNTNTNDHPYLSFDYKNYYKHITQSSSNTDCITDFCYYNECNSSSPLFLPPLNTQFMPNCYCLPLYSKDSISPPIPNFHSVIKDAYPYQDNKANEGFYTYNYPNKAPLTTSYFDFEGEREFKCRLSFNRKSIRKPSSFNAKISLQRITSMDDTSMLLVFLLNNDQIDKSIKDKYDQYISDIMWMLYLIYAILLLVLIVAMTYIMYRSVLKLTMKMKKFEEYRNKIIPMTDSNGNGNGGKLNTDHNNNNDDEGKANSFLNNKLVPLLRKIHFFDNEEDELDKLLNLISNHIDYFKIDFSINENINDNIREIQKQYHEMNKIMNYKNLFFFQRSQRRKKKTKPFLSASPSPSSNNNQYKGRKESIEKYLDKSEYGSYGLKDDNKANKDFKENYSLNLLYEMLSMSNKHLLDFNSLKSNFYYIEDTSKSFINFTALDNIIKENSEQYSNETNNVKQINNAIQYYILNIHSYWKQRYNHMKAEEKKSPQSTFI